MQDMKAISTVKPMEPRVLTYKTATYCRETVQAICIDIDGARGGARPNGERSQTDRMPQRIDGTRMELGEEDGVRILSLLWSIMVRVR